MPWRVLTIGEQSWNVSVAAERRGGESWALVLSFRTTEQGQRRGFWAEYPLRSASRSTLFRQADLIPDDALTRILVAHLG